MVGVCTGEVAWVTSGGPGIGGAAAVQLAAAGMRVVLSGRRASELQRVAARIAAAGGQARVAALDVTDKAAVLAVAQGIAATEGRFDISSVPYTPLTLPLNSTVDFRGGRVDIPKNWYSQHIAFVLS